MVREGESSNVSSSPRVARAIASSSACPVGAAHCRGPSCKRNVHADRRSGVGACACAAPAPAPAPAAAPHARPDVIVTASRLEQPLDESLASVTVIRRADIERAQARTVEELLAGVEGLSVAGGGGLGKVTSVFVRGAESDHTLWLVDGVRIGSVTTGTPSLQDLPIDTIERIEIVRGPRSSLYGADAIGGVVQVFTRRGRGAAPSLRLTGGSNGTRQGAASVGFGGEAAWVDLQASHLETDGIDSCRGLPFPPGGGCFISEPDRDPYRNTSGNVRAGWRVSPSLEVQGFVQRSEGRGDFDGSFVNESDIANQVAGLELAAEPRRGLALEADGRAFVGTRSRASATARSAACSTPGATAPPGRTTSRSARRPAGARPRLAAGPGREQHAVRRGLALEPRGLRAVPAGPSAGTSSPRRPGSTTTNSSARTRPAASRGAWASRAGCTSMPAPARPSRRRRSTSCISPVSATRDSIPRRRSSLEVGLKQSTGWGRWTLAAFGSDVDDLIAFDSATFLPQNVARARLAGVEGSLRVQRAGWRLEQSLTWLDAEDRSAGSTRGRELPRRPALSGRTTLGWSTDRLDLGVSAQFAGRRYDDLANRQALGSYAVVDLTGGWRLSASTEVQLRVANLFDREYETAYLYPSLGREAFVTVRYRAP